MGADAHTCHLRDPLAGSVADECCEMISRIVQVEEESMSFQRDCSTMTLQIGNQDVIVFACCKTRPDLVPFFTRESAMDEEDGLRGIWIVQFMRQDDLLHIDRSR